MRYAISREPSLYLLQESRLLRTFHLHDDKIAEGLDKSLRENRLEDPAPLIEQSKDGKVILEHVAMIRDPTADPALSMASQLENMKGKPRWI